MPLNTLNATKGISDVSFDKSVILAVPLQIYESTKYEGRGDRSLTVSLTVLTHSTRHGHSGWMHSEQDGLKPIFRIALYHTIRKQGRSYVPIHLTIVILHQTMTCRKRQRIRCRQTSRRSPRKLPGILLHSPGSLLAGVISPSTLGIDVKKLDNAEAQREKEKATLYTRNAIIEALQETLPELVSTCINAYNILIHKPVEEVMVNIPFGEYANPSFESQVETIGKAKTQGIMSIERVVEELYGDSLDEHCKQEEIQRLKIEQGIADVEEPGMNLEGVMIDAGHSEKPNVSDEPEGVPGVAAGGPGTGAAGDIRPGKE